MTTYYVDGAVGADINDGLAEGAGNAWATIQKAMDTVVAGDKVWVKASATYDEYVQVTGANNGILSSPVEWEGYTSILGDRGKVTCTNQTGFGNSCLFGNSTTSYYWFKNFIFSLATVGVQSCRYMIFDNCEFVNNSAQGVAGCVVMSFRNCIFSNNGSVGVINGGSTHNLNSCIIANNGTNGYDGVNNENILYRCLVYGNGATSDTLYRMGDFSHIIGCTIDGNATTSAAVAAAANEWPFTFVDNLIHNSSTGFTASVTTSPRQFIGIYSNNVFTDSVTTPYNANSGNFFADGKFDIVGGDPEFLDAAGGDYRIGSTSVAKDSGTAPGGIT